MPRALITGGNSKFGKDFVSELSSRGYLVTVIDRNDLLHKDLDKYRGAYELVFFNHHYMPADFDYNSFDMSCLVCLDILDIVFEPDKVGWMVSSGIGAKNMPEFAPYFAYKSVNVHIMRYLAWRSHGTYFGVDPGHLIEDHWKMPAKQVADLLDKVENGKVYNLSGSVSGL